MITFSMDTDHKLVIVINGKGGVGKDALCHALATVYRVANISAITPIKEIAADYGWRGEKDARSRRFLAELKRVFADYNDLPNQYLLQEYERFLASDRQILCVHIREQDQIDKFVAALRSPWVTLLVRRKAVGNAQAYGNQADDAVDDYPYDYIFDNDARLKESAAAFCRLIDRIWEKTFN